MTDFNPDRIYAALVKAGGEWADCESAACLLEETKKTVLAELINQSTDTYPQLPWIICGGSGLSA